MIILSTEQIQQHLDEMADNIRQQVAIDEHTLVVGIHTGGAWLAEGLHQRLGVASPLATLDISFYRDDFSRTGLHPTVKPSQIHGSVDDKNIILVDDILFTGRTIRAALSELFDFGRPQKILLSALVDRGQRELPIQADVLGISLQLPDNQHLKLHGPDTLHLEQF